MLNKSHQSALVFAAFLCGSASILPSAFADTAPSVAAGKAQSAMMDKRMTVSDDGFQAERDIGEARIAIFEGHPDAAKTAVTAAQGQLKTVAAKVSQDKASQDLGTAAPQGSDKTPGDPDLVPIDGQMVVADDMVLTPDKAAKVKEANAHLQNGETDKAMDTLKQGAIDVAFTRVLMPVSATTTHVDAAAKLLDDGKYYEANLALKAAQDLIRTDTVAFGDTAAQASKVTGVPAATVTPQVSATAKK